MTVQAVRMAAQFANAPSAPMFGNYTVTPKAGTDLALPPVIYPTAIYAPGMPVPENPSDKEFGAWLLSYSAMVFDYYSRYQKVGDLWTITLWNAITHIRNPKTKRPLIPMIPRLIMIGESGCGKSTDLQLLNLMAARTDDLELEPSEPAVRSILGDENLTLLLDEADILFGAGSRKASIRSILNASAYPNGHTDRIQQGKRVKVPVYGPAAIAALPTMEVATGGVLESLLNRSHKIYKVAPPEEIPQILEEPQGQELARGIGLLLEAWISRNLDEIVAAIPTVPMPGGMIHREASKWKAMLAIAQVAGGMWPEYAASAALGRKDVGSLSSIGEGLAKLVG